MPGAYLEAWDATNEKWIKVKVDTEGRLLTVVTLPHLDDIEDVEVTGPTDLYILYWNNTNSRFELRAFTDWLHKTAHQAGGTDVISIAGLAGEATARQKSKTGDSTLGWTDEKLLKGAGAGVAPDLIDVPEVGIWIEIGDHVVSGTEASISFSSIPSGYAALQLIYDNLKGDDTALKKILVTFNDDATADNYNYSIKGEAPVNSTIMTIANIADSDADDWHASGNFLIANKDGQMKMMLGLSGSHKATGASVSSSYSCQSWETTDEITKVTLTPSGGNFDAGRVILLGLAT